MIDNESAQIKAALAGDAPAFVRTVYQQARDYNQLVFTSAVFGVRPARSRDSRSPAVTVNDAASEAPACQRAAASSVAS